MNQENILYLILKAMTKSDDVERVLWQMSQKVGNCLALVCINFHNMLTAKVGSSPVARCVTMKPSCFDDMKKFPLWCERLRASCTEHLTDQHLKKLGELDNRVISLNLAMCRSITTSGLAGLLRHKCNILTTLSLYGCSGLTDTCIADLARVCNNLEDLDISWCGNFTGKCLEILLLNCTSLTSLNASSTDITDAALRSLARACPGLKCLVIADCQKVTDEGILAVREACHGIEKLKYTGPHGNSLLHLAIEKGGIKVIAFLLAHEHGADINAPNNVGNTPLHLAVAASDIEVVAFLLEHGANPNATNITGNTPLHLAVSTGDIEVVNVLVGHGADINAPNNVGNRPLHLVVAARDIEVVNVLVDHGADINAQNNIGNTPLHLAVSTGDIEVVNVLVGHGADINAPINAPKIMLDLMI
jgi:hypothetical protein